MNGGPLMRPRDARLAKCALMPDRWQHLGLC
jgi:hypothetical protein